MYLAMGEVVDSAGKRLDGVGGPIGSGSADMDERGSSE